MFSLLSEFTRQLGKEIVVLVMNPNELDQPRQYTVQSTKVVLFLVGGVVSASVLLVAIILLTPLGSMLPGHVSDELRQDARINQLRMAAMEDTLRMQYEYVSQLRSLMMGTVDTTVTALTRSSLSAPTRTGEVIEFPSEPPTDDFEDHLQPAFPLDRLNVFASSTASGNVEVAPSLAAVQFPVMPPVSGLTTRFYDARTGHFAIDIAAKVGSLVRSIGDGYVILADWTHDGGQIIGIQHGDGYVSVYKHNSRLLKRVGDHVRAREAIAMSGTSGEITTGPHLHFEIWQNGLAQDPIFYVTGL
jgi:murein DD-endopeptidase MepM/ murein hydrolase activator NlpD